MAYGWSAERTQNGDLNEEYFAIDESSPVTPMTALVIDSDGRLTYMGEDGCRVRLLVILSSSNGFDNSKVRTQPIATAVCTRSWFRQIALNQPEASFFFGIE